MPRRLPRRASNPETCGRVARPGDGEVVISLEDGEEADGGRKFQRPDRRRLPVNLRDVADRAGVSMATASRVMNQPELVRAALRDRVAAAAQALHYVPNPAARALSGRRSLRIGVLAPTLDSTIVARFLEGAARRLRAEAYGVLMSFADGDGRVEAAEMRSLMSAGIDGMILVGERRDPELYPLLDATRTPFVLADVSTALPRRVSVGEDSRAGAVTLVRHLLDLGHREFAVLEETTTIGEKPARRVDGVRAELALRGMSLSAGAVLERRCSISDGREGLRALMAARPETTAVVAGSDLLAIGAIVEARALGLRVPEDLSIVGYGGLEFVAQLDFGLTTMLVPMAEMGHKAAEALLALLAGQTPPTLTIVDNELVIRGSSAVPRARATV